MMKENSLQTSFFFFCVLQIYDYLNKYFIRNFFFSSQLFRAQEGLDLWLAAHNDTSRRWSLIIAVCQDDLSSEWDH